MYDDGMEKSASQFDLKFLLAVTAIIAGGLAGWRIGPVLFAVQSELRWWIGLGFYTIPFLLPVGLVVDRELRWGMCLPIGIVSAIFLAGYTLNLESAAIAWLFFGAVAIALFCLFASVRALRNHIKITTTAVGVSASWWIGCIVGYFWNQM